MRRRLVRLGLRSVEDYAAWRRARRFALSTDKRYCDLEAELQAFEREQKRAAAGAARPQRGEAHRAHLRGGNQVGGP